MLKKVFYGLLSMLLFVLILEHFAMSSLISAAYQQVAHMHSHDGRHAGEHFAGPNGTDGDSDDYGAKLEALSALPKVYKKAEKELRELEATQGMSPQAAEIKNYLEWLFSIPWLKSDKTVVDLKKAKEILDRDHQGLTKAKERILEYLAVLKRAPKGGKAPVLCFVGPPGVGKTTLGKSIAEAMGRKFVRVSLGGVSDEASIRGFMRTYMSSKPGKIIEALKEAGTSNPVILLDEVEKLGKQSHHGDPSAALLEVLDPSQNKEFKDHYLELGVDLSEVTFIATANSLDMHEALLDRMEIVQLPGYTPEEKLSIAKEHLVSKKMKENGLKEGEFSVSDDAIKQLISDYTMEAGVRQLDRAIDTLCRKVVKESYEGERPSPEIKPEALHGYLGNPPVPGTRVLTVNTVGVTQGLAWSPVGGGVLQLEAVILPGDGKIVKTGNLGEISQESIMAALTVAKKMLPEYKLDPRFLKDKDIHIHSPAGGKKDGPSAGITITTSIVSAITNIPVNKDVCMTGEINLHGDVLPIGGLKEKLIGAYSAGLKIAVIPADNQKDLEDVPQQVKDAMKIIPAKHISEVLKVALVR